MKAPPKRKGNRVGYLSTRGSKPALDESPPEKEGKFAGRLGRLVLPQLASMKAPPKRKGNRYRTDRRGCSRRCLNESPSEKEGKCRF